VVNGEEVERGGGREEWEKRGERGERGNKGKERKGKREREEDKHHTSSYTLRRRTQHKRSGSC
jgi:hypothetical protein